MRFNLTRGGRDSSSKKAAALRVMASAALRGRRQSPAHRAWRRKRGERGGSPRASPCSVARPEVLVLHLGVRGEGAVVVVQVQLRDARAEECMAAPTPESWGAPVGRLREMQVADVEADAYRVEVAGLEDVEQVLRAW